MLRYIIGLIRGLKNAKIRISMYLKYPLNLFVFKEYGVLAFSLTYVTII